MAGAQIIFSVDDAQVMALLERCRNMGLSFKVPLTQAGIYAMRQTDLHFQNQHGPTEKWKALLPSTEARRRKGKGSGGNQILRDTGTLMRSVGFNRGAGHIERSDNFSFTFGTNVVYAATHQYGDERTVTVSAGTQTLRFKVNKFGLLATQKKNKNLLRFAKKTDKFALTGSVGRKEYSRKRNIKARPFLWLNQEDVEKINGIFTTWAQKQLGGR